MSARFEPNEAGWRALALSKDIQDPCVAEARRGMAFAVAISPRGEQRRRGRQRYSESFHVERTIVSDVGRRQPRVAARLINTAPHAAAVEFGNAQTPQPRRVLGRTAAFLGGGAGPLPAPPSD